MSMVGIIYAMKGRDRMGALAMIREQDRRLGQISLSIGWICWTGNAG
jgi:hypothetical protein